MIKIFFSKLKNGNLEITEKMLNDILSHMKVQDCLSSNFTCYMEIKDKQIERLNNIINEALEYIEDENIDITTIRFNDIQDVKKDLLDILKRR